MSTSRPCSAASASANSTERTPYSRVISKCGIAPTHVGPQLDGPPHQRFAVREGEDALLRERHQLQRHLPGDLLAQLQQRPQRRQLGVADVDVAADEQHAVRELPAQHRPDPLLDVLDGQILDPLAPDRDALEQRAGHGCSAAARPSARRRDGCAARPAPASPGSRRGRWSRGPRQPSAGTRTPPSTARSTGVLVRGRTALRSRRSITPYTLALEWNGGPSVSRRSAADGSPPAPGARCPGPGCARRRRPGRPSRPRSTSRSSGGGSRTSIRSPGRGTATWMPLASAAASVRSTGSAQRWNARLNVAQWIGRSTPPPRSPCARTASSGSMWMKCQRVVVGADRQQGQVERAQPRADPGERRVVAGVAAEEHAVPRAGDRPRRPQRGVAVEVAPGEVPRLGAGEGQPGDGRALVPVQLHDPVLGHAPLAQVLADADRDDERRATASPPARGPWAGRGGRSGRGRSARRRPAAVRRGGPAARAGGSARTPATASTRSPQTGSTRTRAPSTSSSALACPNQVTASSAASAGSSACASGIGPPGTRRAAPRATAAAGRRGCSPGPARGSPACCGTCRRSSAGSRRPPGAAGGGARPARSAGPRRRG